MNNNKKMFKNIFICLKNTLQLIKIYLLWIILHYCAAHLYVKFCTYNSMIGFVISPFLTSSVHCDGLRWVINQGATSIKCMWLVLGTYITSKLIHK